MSGPDLEARLDARIGRWRAHGTVLLGADEKLFKESLDAIRALRTERDALAKKHYMVCTVCSWAVSEETWNRFPRHGPIRCAGCNGRPGMWQRGHSFYKGKCEAAEARTTALEADVARLTDALTEIDATGKAADSYSGDRLSPEEVYMGAVGKMRSIARSAAGVRA